jgi:hypothetical protein
VGPEWEDGWLRAVGGYPYHSRVGQKGRWVQGVQPEGSGQKQRVTLAGKVSYRSHTQVRRRQLLSVVFSITVLLLVVVVVGVDIVVVVVIMVSIDIDIVSLVVVVVVVITFIIVSLPVGEVVTMAVVVVIVIVIVIAAVVCVTVFARSTQYSVNAKRQPATRVDAAFFITNFFHSVLPLVGI